MLSCGCLFPLAQFGPEFVSHDHAPLLATVAEDRIPFGRGTSVFKAPPLGAGRQ